MDTKTYRVQVTFTLLALDEADAEYAVELALDGMDTDSGITLTTHGSAVEVETSAGVHDEGSK